MEIMPVYEAHADRKPEFLVGSNLEIYQRQFAEDLSQVFLSIVTIVLGIVFTIMGFIRLIRFLLCRKLQANFLKKYTRGERR